MVCVFIHLTLNLCLHYKQKYNMKWAAYIRYKMSWTSFPQPPRGNISVFGFGKHFLYTNPFILRHIWCGAQQSLSLEHVSQCPAQHKWLCLHFMRLSQWNWNKHGWPIPDFAHLGLVPGCNSSHTPLQHSLSMLQPSFAHLHLWEYLIAENGGKVQHVNSRTIFQNRCCTKRYPYSYTLTCICK